MNIRILRSLLTVALGALCACGADNGSGGGSGSSAGGGATALNWNSTASSGSGSTTSPLNWVSPNSGLGATTGGSSPIVSTNERTYTTPTLYLVGNEHPLMTTTTSSSITTPENELAVLINSYRQGVLGYSLGAGSNGLIGGFTPIHTGTNQTIYLGMNLGLQKNSRAHCSHAAYFHPGPLTGTNAEGDGLASGGVAPIGRLAKCLITTTSRLELPASGAAVPTAQDAFDYYVNGFASTLAGGYSHMGVGSWVGGSEGHYWNVIVASGPNPP